MEIFAYFSAILIGVSIGLIGSGGSILTVPILVYLLALDPTIATGYSLFIVGFSSLVGGGVKLKYRLVNFRMVWVLGLPSLAMVLFTRAVIMPKIPPVLGEFVGITITKSVFLMLLFALIMITASYSMIKFPNPIKKTEKPKVNPWFVLFIGVLLGVVTGMVGAGGGFLIVPALVLVMRIPMHTAVGTSMWIVAVNSLLGFTGYWWTLESPIDWGLLSIFTSTSLLGIAIGILLGRKISGEKLKKGFGYFVLVMGIYILSTEIIGILP